MATNRSRYAIAATLLIGALALSTAPAVSAQPVGQRMTSAQQQALRAGVQIAPKGKPSKTTADQPNPYLANLPDVSRVDYSAWRERLAAQGAVRARSAATQAAKVKAAGGSLTPPLMHDEEEPAGTLGSNDTRGTAERILDFGTAKKKNPRVRILGDLPDLSPSPDALAPSAEDNGQLSLAANSKITGLAAVTTTGLLGDGPHGSTGDKKNDFDFYRLTSTAGLSITVDTSASPLNPEGNATDTVLAIYDGTGKMLAVDDDSGTAPFSSKLTFPVPANGAYYVLVAGFSEAGPFPANPADSGSGAGGAAEGQYSLKISAAPVDIDYYAVNLAKGDVVGVTGSAGATKVTMFRTDATEMIGSSQDLSYFYPPNSPLPGGGRAVLAYVAEKSGRYAFRVDGVIGRYDVSVEAYRPGSEIDPSSKVQTVFLDFDGARMNTAIWGGPGVRTLSPLSAFLGAWGLSRGQEATLIKRITAGVQENIQKDLASKGLNKNLSVRVVSSQASADIFGQTNVSRVIVGGTIEQSGLSTIGVAQYIDPGNYGHEDSALVLLDTLSGGAAADTSLNHYLKPSSNRVAFISQAVSNVISHEIGHLIGNYHTDNLDATRSLMDAGGANYANLYGVGADNIGGTPDDWDVDFVLDGYIPQEEFTGMENTLNVSSWAFVKSPKG